MSTQNGLQSVTELVSELRLRLKALPFSARRIARTARVDPKTVGNILSGADPMPATFDALAKALPTLEAEATSKSEAA